MKSKSSITAHKAPHPAWECTTWAIGAVGLPLILILWVWKFKNEPFRLLLSQGELLLIATSAIGSTLAAELLLRTGKGGALRAMRLVIFVLIVLDLLGYTGMLTSDKTGISNGSILACSILLAASLICGIISTWLYATERNSSPEIEW
jgi:hypothetical protein